jgi:hypothetical protein
MPAHNPLKSALTPKPDCLSLEQLEALAADPKPSHPHLSDCLRCQAELTLLKQFESNEPLPDEGAAVAWISSHLERNLEQIKHPGRAASAQRDRTSAGFWSRLIGRDKFGFLVPTVAVLTMAVIGFIVLRPAREPELRAGLETSSPVFRSQEVEVIGASGDLENPPAKLEWKPYPGAASYKVSVMEIDQTVLWARETAGNSVELPAAVRAKILPSKPILWQVTAEDLQGKVLASSQRQRFVVAPKRSGVNN